MRIVSYCKIDVFFDDEMFLFLIEGNFEDLEIVEF